MWKCPNQEWQKEAKKWTKKDEKCDKIGATR